MLGFLTTNELTIKDYFTFAKKLQNFVFKFMMASFEIESPFTNVPLQETIELCVENLFKNRTHVQDLSQDFFHEFPMFFSCCHEKMWLQNCSSEFKLVMYRRYLNDTFLFSCSI